MRKAPNITKKKIKEFIRKFQRSFTGNIMKLNLHKTPITRNSIFNELIEKR